MSEDLKNGDMVYVSEFSVEEAKAKQIIGRFIGMAQGGGYVTEAMDGKVLASTKYAIKVLDKRITPFTKEEIFNLWADYNPAFRFKNHIIIFRIISIDMNSDFVFLKQANESSIKYHQCGQLEYWLDGAWHSLEKVTLG